MQKCSFCGKIIEPGTGILFAKNDGKLFWFCKRKCEKNMFKLGRNPRKTEWTEDYKKEKEQRIKLMKRKEDKNVKPS